VGLILERQGCQRVSGHAQQQQTSDNQTPTKLTSCIASTHGQVRSPRKPSERLELVWAIRVMRITKLIRIIGFPEVTRVLSFSRNFSVDRAGLREAARVLGEIIWSNGL
jgi:hypothetical protein